MAYKSGNPALNKNTFKSLAAAADHKHMTLNGVVVKSLFMFVLCVSAGVAGWNTASNMTSGGGGFLLLASIVAFVIGLVTVFKKTWSPITAPIYAIAEGFLLGFISQLYNTAFNGIVIQAILLTGGIFVAMLVVYLTRLIKVTENLKLGIAAATLGIFLFYLATLVLSIFGVNVPLVNSNSGWGIAFSVIVVCVAAMNLVVDFDFIEQGVEQKAPKYMEWYSSFGLFVTLIWLYLEILRLLAKSRSR